MYRKGSLFYTPTESLHDYKAVHSTENSAGACMTMSLAGEWFNLIKVFFRNIHMYLVQNCITELRLY